jgi:hypothetical protein
MILEEIISTVIKRLIELLPGIIAAKAEKRQQFFKNQIRPIFDSLEQIHKFYNELILETRSRVAEIHSDTYLLSDERRSKLNEVKGEFLRRREQDEYLRDVLRQDAQQIFAAIAWPEERRFLASIVRYFLDDSRHGIPRTNKEVDSDIQ